jgi:hypothetical protein
VLVGGGGIDLPIEWIHPDGRLVTIASSADVGLREGAVFVRSADAAQALLLGGVDGSAAAWTTTWLVSGCPTACTATSGPAWAEARGGAVALPERSLVVGGEGPSERVERVVFGAGTATIEDAGSLAVARRGHAVVPHSRHSFFVLAGEGGSGFRRDVEVCFID